MGEQREATHIIYMLSMHLTCANLGGGVLFYGRCQSTTRSNIGSTYSSFSNQSYGRGRPWRFEKARILSEASFS